MKLLIATLLISASLISFTNCDAATESEKLSTAFKKVIATLSEERAVIKPLTEKLVKLVDENPGDLNAQLKAGVTDLETRQHHIKQVLGAGILSLTNWAGALSDDLKEKWSAQIAVIREKQQTVLNELHGHAAKSEEVLKNLSDALDAQKDASELKDAVKAVSAQATLVGKYVLATLMKLGEWIKTLN